MTEIWKSVVGFEGFYEVSDQGNIRSLYRESVHKGRWGDAKMRFPAKQLRISRTRFGYCYVSLSKDEVREVYERFNEGYTLSDSGEVSVRKFIEQLGMHAVIDAMEAAYTRPSVRRGFEFKYFCGICWNMIRSQRNGQS